MRLWPKWLRLSRRQRRAITPEEVQRAIHNAEELLRSLRVMYTRVGGDRDRG